MSSTISFTGYRLRALGTGWLLLGLLILPFSGTSAFGQTVVTTGASSGTTVVYNAAGVSTSGTVVVSGTANVAYVADNHVTLNPGFKVAAGATFRAKTGTDVDEDGMPNSWEYANNLSLLVNDAAGDADGDGISNLSEYQLGTNPNGSAANSADTANSAALKIHKPQS